MGFRSRTTLVVCAALFFGAGLAEARQAPVLSPATVNFANITLSWSATAGATGYRVEAGVASGVYLGGVPVGSVTTLNFNAQAVGTYFARVVAITPAGDMASNEVPLTITSLVAPPGVPTSVQAFSYCNSVGLSWAPGPGAPPTSYVVKASRTAGAVEVTLPLVASQFFTPSPGGTLFFRVAAVVGGVVSADSQEISVVTTAGIGNAPQATFTSNNFGSLASLRWTAPGATAFSLDAYQDGAFVGSAAVPAANAALIRYLPAASWRIDATPIFSCGTGSPTSNSFSTPDPTTAKMQPREADPSAGGVLGRPGYLGAVVRDIANRFPAELRQSCREAGGNNRWLFRLLSELRTRDKRWGLNWKRANVGDMSQDIVTFNHSSDPDEGTYNTRVFDVIGGHCGPNPSWNEAEQTVLGSRGSIWTLQPYIEAGYTP